MNMCNMTINVMCQLLLLAKAWKSVEHINQEINMIKELTLTLIIWIPSSQIYYFISIWKFAGKNYQVLESSKEVLTCFTFILTLPLCRNLGIAVSILYTCIIDKSDSEFIRRLNSEANSESDYIRGVEDILRSGKATAMFKKFLRSKENVVALNYIEIYSILEDFEKYIENTDDVIKRRDKYVETLDLIDSYKEIDKDLASCIKSIKENITEVSKRSFSQVYALIMTELQNAHTHFSQSNEYAQLVQEFSQVYGFNVFKGVLKRAGMIS
eukprot:TRINITY_DN7792_c0_g1_i5.p1 TRINITY_DN7792_c0_g1~~TRINITY_DN7792_c0_g1_i5.p1  ORF type:complete len:269 (+),score=61.68 TRINITY_DN7792_c0_g1_i5:684-1490(+)